MSPGPAPLYPSPSFGPPGGAGSLLSSLLARLCLLRFAPGRRKGIGRCPAGRRTRVHQASGTPLSRRDVRLREGPAHFNDWQPRQPTCHQAVQLRIVLDAIETAAAHHERRLATDLLEQRPLLRTLRNRAERAWWHQGHLRRERARRYQRLSPARVSEPELHPGRNLPLRIASQLLHACAIARGRRQRRQRAIGYDVQPPFQRTLAYELISHDGVRQRELGAGGDLPLYTVAKLPHARSVVWRCGYLRQSARRHYVRRRFQSARADQRIPDFRRR